MDRPRHTEGDQEVFRFRADLLVDVALDHVNRELDIGRGLERRAGEFAVALRRVRIANPEQRADQVAGVDRARVDAASLARGLLVGADLVEPHDERVARQRAFDVEGTGGRVATDAEARRLGVAIVVKGPCPDGVAVLDGGDHGTAQQDARASPLETNYLAKRS